MYSIYLFGAKRKTELRIGIKASLHKQPTRILTSTLLVLSYPTEGEWVSSWVVLSCLQKSEVYYFSAYAYSQALQVVRSQMIWCFIYRSLFSLPGIPRHHYTNKNVLIKKRVKLVSKGLFLSWANEKKKPLDDSYCSNIQEKIKNLARA